HPVDRRAQVGGGHSGHADDEGEAPMHAAAKPWEHGNGGGCSDYDQGARNGLGEGQAYTVDKGGDREYRPAPADQA
ncbi:hypothetical protein QN416_27325, partial [Glaciimonas sp. Cout2]